MRRFVFVAVLLLIGLSTVALAERPACPGGQGACFIDLGPLWGVLTTVDNGVAYCYSDEPNDFVRVGPRGMRVHGIYKDIPLMFCPPDVVAEGLCDPLNPDPRVFMGTADVQVNIDLEGMATCPSSIHERGVAYSPGGAAFDFRADFVSVPDPHSESGCREVQREISLTLRS